MKSSVLALMILALTSCRHQQPTVRSVASDKSSEQKQACIVSVCGPTSHNLTSFEADTQKANPVLYQPGSDLYQSMDALFRQFAKSTLQVFPSTVSAVEYLLKHPEEKIPAPVQIYIHAAYYLNLQIQVLTELQKQEKIKTVSQLTINDFDFLNLSLSEKQWVETILKSGYFKKAPNYNVDETLHNYLDRKYPHQLFKYSYPKALEQCREQVKQIEAFMAGLLDVQKLFIYCGKNNEVQWSVIDDFRFVEELKVAELMIFLRAQPIEKLILRRPWNWHQELTAYSEKPVFLTYKRLAQKSDEQMQPFVNGAVQACHMSVGSSIETSPSQLLRQKAIDSIGDIKRKAKQLVRFKQTSVQKKWDILLSSTWYVFPMVTDVLIQNIHQRFQAEESSMLIQHSNRQAASVLFEIFSSPDLSVSKASPLKQEMDAVTKALKNMRDICRQYESETLTDHIYASDGNVYLSWLTLKFPDLGYGIIAHELGHHVSYLIQSELKRRRNITFKDLLVENSIWTARQCVEKYHTGALHVNTSPYVEEDWADYFASQIIKMKHQEGGDVINFACALQQETENMYEASFESDPTGKYPSALFRLLHIEKNSRALSNPCDKVLVTYPTPSCF